MSTWMPYKTGFGRRPKIGRISRGLRLATGDLGLWRSSGQSSGNLGATPSRGRKIAHKGPPNDTSTDPVRICSRARVSSARAIVASRFMIPPPASSMPSARDARRSIVSSRSPIAVYPSRDVALASVTLQTLTDDRSSSLSTDRAEDHWTSLESVLYGPADCRPPEWEDDAHLSALLNVGIVLK